MLNRALRVDDLEQSTDSSSSSTGGESGSTSDSASAAAVAPVNTTVRSLVSDLFNAFVGSSSDTAQITGQVEEKLINLDQSIKGALEESEGQQGLRAAEVTPLTTLTTEGTTQEQLSAASTEMATDRAQQLVPMVVKRPEVSLGDFIRSFELKATANQLSDEKMAVLFPALLEEDSVVHNQLSELTEEEKKSWSKIKAILTKQEEPMRLQYLLRVTEIRYDKSKDPLKLKEEISKLIDKLYPNAAKKVKAQMLVDAFILALPRELRSQVCLKAPRTIDEVLQLVEFMKQLQPESVGHSFRQHRPSNPSSHHGSKDQQRPKSTFKPSRGDSRPGKHKKKEEGCFECGSKDHWARNCPKKADVAALHAVTEPAKVTPRTMVKVTVNGTDHKVLFDNGSVTSILPEQSFKAAVECKRVFGTPNHGKLPTRGYQIASFDFNGLQINHSCNVGPSSMIILGQDFIMKHRVDLNHDRRVTFHLDNGKSFIVRGESEEKKEELVNDSLNSGTYLYSADEDSDTDSIYVVNPEINYVFSEDISESTSEVREQTNQHGQQLTLTQWVHERWPHLFNGLGCTADVVHRIDTGDSRPIQARGKPIPIGLYQRIKDQVNEMLRDQVIEKSRSEWHSPIRPVEKPNGDIRLAINYRRLNQLTRTDAYPMPRMDEALLKLKGAKVLSKIDLRKGYYQIEMAHEDREKTAFSFDGQLYHFTRMPFGLATAPHTFIRLMHQIFHQVKHASVFFDDLIIFSDNVEDHKRHLADVFALLEKHNLKLNGDKSTFGVESVTFLGHVIGNDEVRPHPDKLKAIREYPAPQSLVELQRFLGMANFYRRFIANFGQLAKPLTMLTKCKDWHWGEEQVDAFAVIKKAMMTEPVVRLPDLTKPFIVKTDACMKGAGAVLLQEDENGNRYVVEYFSKAFNKQQLNYPVIEQEATALLWALEHWEYFLVGQKFHLETDHRPLQWLQSKKDCRGKLGRMSLRLQEFAFLTIKHIRGEDNADADALSRVNAIDFEVHAQLAKEQQSDSALTEMKEKQTDKFIVINNLLYFSETGGPDRLCIPRTRVEQILRASHNARAHLGYLKTTEHCRQRYYWPGMGKEIKSWISKCHKCATAKDNPSNTYVAQRPSDVTSKHVWEKLAIDVVGPFTKSTNGNLCVIALTDLFTKWTEIKVLSEVTAEIIVKWLEEEILSRHGYPMEILTDHGSQFDSAYFKSFVKRHCIKHTQSTIYHHESNGQVERFNRTLENMIRCVVDAKQSNWDQYLHKLIFAYRTAIHSTIKMSPFQALFGREARTLMDNKLPVRLNDDERSKVIRTNLVNAAEQRLAQANSKVNEPTYAVHDLIYWSVVPPTNCRKLAPRWSGPFEIVKVNPPNVTIRGSKGNTAEIHMSQIKRCNDPHLTIENLRTRTLKQKNTLQLRREV